jgi:6-phosphogluconate dehydrogenase
MSQGSASGPHGGCDIGLVGLGVMGRNFLLNVAGRGYAVAGYDLDGDKVEQLRADAPAGQTVRATTDLESFVASLRRPRAVMLLVPAGDPVDAVIGDIAPRLAAGDVVVDAGNSHFRDTDRRAAQLARDGLLLLGTGVSGGEYGARHGPSIMPGGPAEAYARVEKIFAAAAARVDGAPCVARLGDGSAGHHVKMVHNGIEYGVMQLIAEVYDLLRRGLGQEVGAAQETFASWSEGPLAGYLIEITAEILTRDDERTRQPLIEVIADAARQKGTGKWTSWDAMDLQVPTPTIDAAVAARNLSALKEQRVALARSLAGSEPPRLADDPAELVPHLHDALHAAMLLTYGQGFALIRRASQEYGYGVAPETVARIWRGGCIIRAALLEDIRAALRADPELDNLLFAPGIGSAVTSNQEALRAAVHAAARGGIPAPALTASLSYLDGYRSARLPANLIQAQRDYFGSHTYERVDAEGTFHTAWRDD